MTSIFKKDHPHGEMIAWGEATWAQRLRMCIFWGIMWGVVAPVVVVGMGGGILYIVGSAGDHIAQSKTQHDRCLKNATNGYDIAQCR